MSRCCSQCGTNGHNSRTCGAESSTGGGGATGDDGCSAEIMLFGVRVKVDPMRKSVSMNNLSQYEQPHEASNAAAAATNAGSASADEAVPHQPSGGRERKRGIPWTEDEHKLFLLGLQKVGKGDWRGISRNFVKTRTPTQVASHAQKYFLRRNYLNRRRRRSSLFDITTDSVSAIPAEDGDRHDGTTQPILPLQTLPSPEKSNIIGYPVAPFPVAVGPFLLPIQFENPMENSTILVHGRNQSNSPSALLVHPPPMADLNLNLNQKSVAEPAPLSLKLSLSWDHNHSPARHSECQAMTSFSNGESIISVA